MELLTPAPGFLFDVKKLLLLRLIWNGETIGKLREKGKGKCGWERTVIRVIGSALKTFQQARSGREGIKCNVGLPVAGGSWQVTKVIKLRYALVSKADASWSPP